MTEQISKIFVMNYDYLQAELSKGQAEFVFTFQCVMQCDHLLTVRSALLSAEYSC